MNDNAEIQSPAQNGQVTPDQLAVIIESHFRTLAIGLVSCSPGIPQNIMWEAIASGMGRVLSGATVSADIRASLEARGRLGDLVNAAIRKAYPAINAAILQAATKPVNGNGIIQAH